MLVRDNLKGLNTKNATAMPQDVLTGKIAYNAEGMFEGTMLNKGNINIGLDTANVSYFIPNGYHIGNGKISIDTQQKNVTPNKILQTISADNGKVLSKVKLEAVTSESGVGKECYDEGYDDGINITKVGNAQVENVLIGKTFTNNSEIGTTGTMPNNGSSSATLDANNVSYSIPEGYNNGNGVININTQTKEITPKETSQSVYSDNGYVINSVKVKAVTKNEGVGKSFYDSGYAAGYNNGYTTGYNNAKKGTATADKVLKGYTFTNNSSVGIEGTLETQTKSATPTGSAQTINPDNGKLLSSVSISAVTKDSGIGKTLYDNGYNAGYTTGYNRGYSVGVAAAKKGTASASDVLTGYTFTNSSNVGISGSMTNNGAISKTINQTNTQTTYYIPAGYHNGSGKVYVYGYGSGG